MAVQLCSTQVRSVDWTLERWLVGGERGKSWLPGGRGIDVRDRVERARWTGFLFNKATLASSILWEEFHLQDEEKERVGERLPKVECGGGEPCFTQTLSWTDTPLTPDTMALTSLLITTDVQAHKKNPTGIWKNIRFQKRGIKLNNQNKNCLVS